jgi:hypothetical protein
MIDPIKLLVLILKQDYPTAQLNSAGLLVQAVLWYEEIKALFIVLGVPNNDLEEYTNDYVNRIYLLKIKNTLLYFFPNLFNTLYNRLDFILWGYTTGHSIHFSFLHFSLG